MIYQIRNTIELEDLDRTHNEGEEEKQRKHDDPTQG